MFSLLFRALLWPTTFWVVNNDPVFAKTTKFGYAIATAANTALDGTGTTYAIATAGGDGSIVTSLKAFARATVTATALRLFMSIDAGTTKVLIDDKLMTAWTIAATTAQPGVTFVSKLSPDDAIRMPANAILYGAIGVALAGGIVFVAEYSDLS
jgi:hypothetical protein